MSFLSTVLTVINPLAGSLVSKSEKEKALSVAAQSALPAVRQKFPGPDKCVLGTELLPYYTGNGVWSTSNPCGDPVTYITTAIEEMKRAISDWHGPRGEQAYVDAYNLVINEYSDYYNAHYLSPEPTPGAGTTDHAATGTPGAGTVTTTTNNTVSKVPAKADHTKLILIVAGVSVLVIVTAIIIKKRMKKSSA